MLWFIYVAYLFLRAFTLGSDAARTLASVYGVAGTAAIPFVYYAVDLAGGATLHPENPARHGLPAGMTWTILCAIAAYLAVFGFLLARRLEVAGLEARIELGETA